MSCIQTDPKLSFVSQVQHAQGVLFGIFEKVGKNTLKCMTFCLHVARGLV